ncbi:MAG: hypothetical protein RL076_1844, partial [Chloroflexota bacterium]
RIDADGGLSPLLLTGHTMDDQAETVLLALARGSGARALSGIPARRGRIAYQESVGWRDVEARMPMRTDAIFRIASMTKPFTSLAIMMLAEQGKLDYDDPVSTYIPELAKLDNTMTIRQLLQHTSGLPNWDDGITDALFAKSAQPTNADMVALLSRKRKLHSAPGSEFYYSNTGYDMLAVVVERVSGETFPQFVQTHILDTLGMTHTLLVADTPPRKRSTVAVSYTGSTDQPEPNDDDSFNQLYGASGIYTTVGDMALYDEALYGDTLVTQKTYKEGIKQTVLSDGSREPYGFGLELLRWHKESYVAHSGIFLAYHSSYVRFPKQHFSVIVLLNRDYDYPDDPRLALQVAEFYLK